MVVSFVACDLSSQEKLFDFVQNMILNMSASSPFVLKNILLLLWKYLVSCVLQKTAAPSI